MARVRKPVAWLGAAVIAVALVVVVAPYAYIHWIKSDPPPKLAADIAAGGVTPTGGTAAATAGSSTTTAAPAAAPSATTPASSDPAAGGSSAISGTWKPTAQSVAGYRVKEVLFGQSAEAVGRTNAVTGQLVIDGTTVPTADFSVDLTTVKSDSGNRDGQFQGRIMDTAKYPTATFQLTQPIDLGSVPAQGQPLTVSAVGDLTLHGTTKSVTIPLAAVLTGGTIEVRGSIDLVFSDWGIPNPSFGPASTQDHGLLEFDLVFAA